MVRHSAPDEWCSPGEKVARNWRGHIGFFSLALLRQLCGCHALADEQLSLVCLLTSMGLHCLGKFNGKQQALLRQCCAL